MPRTQVVSEIVSSRCGSGPTWLRPLESVARFAFSVLGPWLLPMVSAQVPAGSWIMSNAHTEALVTNQAFTWLSWEGMVGTTLTTDERGIIYLLRLGANQHRYHRALWDPVVPSIVVELPGTGLFTNGWPCATRSRLWVLGMNGDVGHVAKSINNQPFTALGNVLTQNSLGSVFVMDVHVDGRDLYFTTAALNTAARVWSVDMTSGTLAARLVTTFPSPVPNVVMVSRGRDGRLLAMGNDALYEVDPRTGLQIWRANKPLDPDFNAPGGSGRIVVAYDPWTDVVAIGPTWHPDITNIYSLALSGSAPFAPAYYFPFFSGLGDLANGSEFPFEYFGKGCPNSLGREPRMGWQGLPRQGQSFTLTLRDAEANGFAILWIGGSDTNWPGFGPLPFDAGVLGAPGCRLFASADFSYVVPVDGSGAASQWIPVPVNPAIYGFEVYAQTASTSGGNALGLAASDALAIRLR